MAHQMETTRVYLDDHRRGVVTCPHCGDTQALNMARYPDALGGKACHVLCGACGRLFRLLFERRRHPRLPVSLPGTLFPSAPQDAPDERSQKLGLHCDHGHLARGRRNRIPPPDAGALPCR